MRSLLVTTDHLCSLAWHQGSTIEIGGDTAFLMGEDDFGPVQFYAALPPLTAEVCS